jgi:hypothetical protein
MRLRHLFVSSKFSDRILEVLETQKWSDQGEVVPPLNPMIGGTRDFRGISENWNETLCGVDQSGNRRAVGIDASARGLSQTERAGENAPGGRLERTLFTLDWISDPALRRRSNAGLKKGEARNALARAVFFHRLGEIRDRTFENQRYRAFGLNLTFAAIINEAKTNRPMPRWTRLCGGEDGRRFRLKKHKLAEGWGREEWGIANWISGFQRTWVDAGHRFLA